MLDEGFDLGLENADPQLGSPPHMRGKFTDVVFILLFAINGSDGATVSIPCQLMRKCAASLLVGVVGDDRTGFLQPDPRFYPLPPRVAKMWITDP